MYSNFWIVCLLIFIGYTTCFCVKKEFFDEPPSVEPKEKEGTKYTIVDVNKVVQGIIKHFGEKDNVNIQITKIIQIINSPGEMKLKLFLYNPIKNTIRGYTVIAEVPVSSKKDAIIKSAVSFSDG